MSGHWASRGHVLHDYLADVPAIGRDAALEKVSEEFVDDCAVIDLNSLPASDPDAYAPEVSFAYNLDTGEVRELGRRLKREQVMALCGERDMPLTIDVLGLTEDAVVVLDYKTGFKRHGAAETLRQLRSYAFAVARYYGRSHAYVGIIRIGDDGQPYFNRGELDGFELVGIEDELREMFARVDEAKAMVARGERPTTTEGEHCTYCPAFTSCPSKMALVAQVAQAPFKVDDWRMDAVTPEQLGKAWTRIKALQKIAERVEKTIKEIAAQTPIPLGDGYVLGPNPEESIRPDIAIQTLKMLYGEDVANAAVSVRTNVSKASIEEALRNGVLQPGMKITHLKRSTFEAIREAGGMGVSFSIERHKPKAALPESSAAALTQGEAP